MEKKAKQMLKEDNSNYLNLGLDDTHDIKQKYVDRCVVENKLKNKQIEENESRVEEIPNETKTMIKKVENQVIEWSDFVDAIRNHLIAKNQKY